MHYARDVLLTPHKRGAAGGVRGLIVLMTMAQYV